MNIIVKQGYTFDYITLGGNVGGFANINKPDGLIINIEEIGNAYYCSFELDGIYIQIWCKEYKIRRINE